MIEEPETPSSEPDPPDAGDTAATSPQAPPTRKAQTAERRWPMATAVLATVVIQIIVPSKGRVPGWQVFPILELAMLAVLIIRDPGRIDRRSQALRRGTIALIAVMTIGTAAAVLALLVDILDNKAGATATVLLGRGGATWITNVIVFSLWYWEFDRGGAAERAARSGRPLSFAFPENAMPEFAATGWMPQYPDYLYLSFTTATAFSPTDTLPVRTWAKMTMMVESVVSLVVGILVIARAINVLPG